MRFIVAPILILTSLLIASHSAQAAIMIESIDEDGSRGRVLIDGQRARIDSGDLGGYILLNLENEKIYAVNHQERVIMELTAEKPSEKTHGKKMNSKAPEIKLINKGKGPVIAGYATTRYRVTVNGLHCFDEYLSEKLLQNSEVKHFVEVIAKSTQAEAEAAIGLPFDAHAPCESAAELVDDYYSRYGIPLRTIESNGLVSHEIKKVETQPDFVPGTFTSPPNYEEVTREEMAQRTIDRVPSHQGSEMSMEDIHKLQEQIKAQMEALQKTRQETQPSPSTAP